MKKRLVLYLTIVVSFFKATYPLNNSQISYPIVQKNDTLKYLRDNFIAHKEKYQHKELNVLLAEMHLVVKSYNLIGGSKPAAPFVCVILQFEDPVAISHKIEDKKAHITSLCIYFQDEIPWKKGMSLYVKTYGAWTEPEKNYYGKMIVKDVKAY